MKSVVHHGRETVYDRADRDASGSPVCFVHGSGGSSAVWKSQHRLADRWPVVTLDLSGHGNSDDVNAEPGFTTLSAYADDVLAVVEDTGARVLVGNSLGGAVAMHALIERPDELDVDAAVLTGTGARLGVLEDLRQWLKDDFDRAVEFLHEEGHLFYDPDPRLRELSIETMHACGQAVTRRDFLTCHRFDVRDRIDGIDAPTLVVYGAHDRLTPPSFHQYLAETIPETELVEIDDAAHLAMLERPTAFNEAVADFLSR